MGGLAALERQGVEKLRWKVVSVEEEEEEGVLKKQVVGVALVQSSSSRAKSRWVKDLSLHLLVRVNGLNPW